jgi:hypothetical protein
MMIIGGVLKTKRLERDSVEKTEEGRKIDLHFTSII